MSNLEKFDIDAIEETFKSFKTGQILRATVVTESADGFVVNIGGKKDGLIEFNDAELASLKGVKTGDSFDAVILNTKSDSGMIMLSKAKADNIKAGNALVGDMKIGDNIKIIITDENKNGLLSNFGSCRVFVPYSQISNRRIDNLKNYINKQVLATVLELNLAEESIIASIRAVEEKEQQDKSTAFWNAIFENKVVLGTVVRITDFGAFVDVDGVDCLVHNSEVSYDSKKAAEILEIGKQYQFRVIRVDRDDKKVSLSIKALQENPLTAKVKAIKVGDIVEGTVTKILPFGALVSFNDVEGLLHVKEASHYFVKNVYEIAKIGQKLTLKVIGVDYDTLKISLSLKALQETPEILKLKEDIKEGNKNE